MLARYLLEFNIKHMVYIFLSILLCRFSFTSFFFFFPVQKMRGLPSTNMVVCKNILLYLYRPCINIFTTVSNSLGDFQC